MTPDVLVVGGGPAGWATARACARRGLRTTLVDPRPDTQWRPTYGSWVRELPADLPPAVIAARGRGVAIGERTHDLVDEYAVLDTDALQAHLRDPAVRVHTGRAVGTSTRSAGSARSTGVTLADGTTLAASTVLDASGPRQVLSRRAPATPRAEQTAFGVIVARDVAARVTADRLLFMDWRPRHGRPGWPTFLYAVPLDGDRVLLEETSLARRPGLPIAELRARLRARLRGAGLTDAEIPDDPSLTERVRFPVDTPVHASPPGVVALGAAAPVMHPASGFSLATSLRLAPEIADALAGALADGISSAAAARRVVRSPAAALVHAMRHRGLDVLLRMSPADVPVFFDRFFALPVAYQRAYLDARDDVPASLSAMLALFGRLTPRLRATLVTGSLLGVTGVRTDHDG